MNSSQVFVESSSNYKRDALVALMQCVEEVKGADWYRRFRKTYYNNKNRFEDTSVLIKKIFDGFREEFAESEKKLNEMEKAFTTSPELILRCF